MREAPIKVQARQPGALKDFGIRALTAVLLGIVLIAGDLAGMFPWAIVVAAVAIPCATEFYAIIRTGRRKPNEMFGIVAVALMPLAAALYASFSGDGASSASMQGAMGLTAVTGGLVLAALLWQVLFRQVSASDTSTTIFGALYTGFMLSHLVLMRALGDGGLFVLMTLISVWAMDVLGYLVGSAIGSHPLAPHVSPKKSWEGFIAGIVGTVATWGAGWWVIRSTLPLWWFLAIGAVVAVAALLGDLAESRMKREAGVKDSGRWLPGHGGFLDRFDSLIVVSIVAYYMLVFGGVK